MSYKIGDKVIIMIPDHICRFHLAEIKGVYESNLYGLNFSPYKDDHIMLFFDYEFIMASKLQKRIYEK